MFLGILIGIYFKYDMCSNTEAFLLLPLLVFPLPDEVLGLGDEEDG